MKIILTSLYMHSDTFIPSSDSKSGAWPSGNLRFEQSYNIHSPMFESCDDQCEISVQINQQISQDQKLIS